MFRARDYEKPAAHMVDQLLRAKQSHDSEIGRPPEAVPILRARLEAALPYMLQTLFERANLVELLRKHELLP